jgi:hydrogenase small subunit
MDSMSQSSLERTAATDAASRLGITRREFLQFCAATATTLGLPAGAEAAIAKANVSECAAT